MWLAIAIPVMIIVIAYAVLSGPDCPRMILGYRCKGRDCDHSPEAIREAKRWMR